MTKIAAAHVLTPKGWRRDCCVSIDRDGRIAAVGDSSAGDADAHVGVLLPAPGNAHSHAFQRAMAGLTEYRASDRDDFWSWRALMYRFVERLTPEDIEAIAAQAQMEMLEAGYAAVGEFHYLHHQPDGTPYENISELSERLYAAAAETGIGYTHLPVLYMRGGMDGRPLGDGQRRFGCTTDRFAALFDAAKKALSNLPADARIGVAPHSLRAVDTDGLNAAASLELSAPIHIHIAEQTGEVEEAERMLGARPVDWLLDHLGADGRWRLVHATHVSDAETARAARAGAGVVVCPVTEANLGDGVFGAEPFLNAGGALSIGTDSNVRISLTEELRLLEYAQRLHHRRRAVLTAEDKSCGRFLYDHAVHGGAAALGRDAGRIAPGALADLVAIDGDALALAGLEGDRLLDAWIFAGDDSLVTDVWAAGRHAVQNGRHMRRDAIASRFRNTIAALRADL